MLYLHMDKNVYYVFGTSNKINVQPLQNQHANTLNKLTFLYEPQSFKVFRVPCLWTYTVDSPVQVKTQSFNAINFPVLQYIVPSTKGAYPFVSGCPLLLHYLPIRS